MKKETWPACLGGSIENVIAKAEKMEILRKRRWSMAHLTVYRDWITRLWSSLYRYELDGEDGDLTTTWKYDCGLAVDGEVIVLLNWNGGIEDANDIGINLRATRDIDRETRNSSNRRSADAQSVVQKLHCIVLYQPSMNGIKKKGTPSSFFNIDWCKLAKDRYTQAAGLRTICRMYWTAMRNSWLWSNHFASLFVCNSKLSARKLYRLQWI